MGTNYKVGLKSLKHALSKVLAACRRDTLYLIFEFMQNRYKSDLYDVRVKNIYGCNIDGMDRVDARIDGVFYQCFKLTSPREYAVFEYDAKDNLRFDKEWTSKVEIKDMVGKYGSYKHMELLGVYTTTGLLNDYETL